MENVSSRTVSRLDTRRSTGNSHLKFKKETKKKNIVVEVLTP